MPDRMLRLLPGEVAKDVEGYEGLYLITSFGRVWGRKYKKFLKPCISKSRYLRTTLYKNNKPKDYLTHRLVTINFMSNPDNLPEVNHKDSDKSNNNANNLEWCTSQSNSNHAMLNGLTMTKHQSKYHGISYDKRVKCSKKPWQAKVSYNGKRYRSKYFATDLEAAVAYNQMVKEYSLDNPLNTL